MDSTSPLQRAVDRCYEVFSRCSQPLVLDVSPLRNQDRLKVLTSLPLRLLSDEQIGPYAGWALTTVGGIDDFRYFLPRILEQATQERSWPGLDPAVIGEKLKRAKWLDWREVEQAAIRSLFEEAWRQALLRHSDEENAEDWLCGMGVLNFGVLSALEALGNSHAINSALQLTNIVRSLIFERNSDESGYWSYVDEGNLNAIRKWLLDEGFEKLSCSKDRVSSSDLWAVERALEVLKEQKQLRLQ